MSIPSLLATAKRRIVHVYRCPATRGDARFGPTIRDARTGPKPGSALPAVDRLRWKETQGGRHPAPVSRLLAGLANSAIAATMILLIASAAATGAILVDRLLPM